jgi:hypothetical protein
VLHNHKRFPSLSWTVQHVFTHGRRYKVAMGQKGLLPALVECGRDAIEGWINHSARADAECVAGAQEPPPWPRVSCRAVEVLPKPDGHAAADEGRSLEGRGLRAGAVARRQAQRANRTRTPPQAQLCRPRLEPVLPLEKSGLYKQAEGWCAQQLPTDRGPCPGRQAAAW